jgi:hypothetical protein
MLAIHDLFFLNGGSVELRLLFNASEARDSMPTSVKSGIAHVGVVAGSSCDWTHSSLLGAMLFGECGIDLGITELMRVFQVMQS